jgi:hypothetical protein
MRSTKGHFQLGHSGGRPKGARNRLAAQVFEDILHHWCEPAAPGSKCKGAEALETLYKEKPGEYLRLTASVLPREFIFENVTSDLDPAMKQPTASGVNRQRNLCPLCAPEPLTTMEAICR